MQPLLKTAAMTSRRSESEYYVAVLGFSEIERVVLQSIFGLAARRVPTFVQHTLATGRRPDIYLVDADDPIAVEALQDVNASRQTPSLLIGADSRGVGWPILARPLQWTRLIRAFDLAITLPLANATIPATRAIHTTSSTQVQAPAPDVLPPISTPTRLIASDSPVESTPATESDKSTQEVPVEPAPTAAVVHAVEVAPIIPVRVPAQVAPVVVAPTVASPVPSPWSAVVASQNDRSNEAPDKPLLLAESRPRTTPKMREADWVLVVDDSATVREFMKGRLAPFGFNVDYAASGEEAIGLTGKRFYTCIFLDVVMPGADGYQVCKMIKSIRGVRKSSIVMLTSRGSPFDKIRGTMAGCDAYLTKPLDEDKLLHTIGKLLPNAVATA